MAAMPSSTSAGVLGMTRTTATPSGTRDSMKAVVMPAARLTIELSGAQHGRDLLEHVGHVLRLDHERDGVGLGGRLEVGDHGDAVALLELAGPLGTLLADEQLVDATAGAHQAGQEGLAHHAGADDCCGHGGNLLRGPEISTRTSRSRASTAVLAQPGPRRARSFVADAAGYFFETRERRKKVRFCGRSAIRRMR